jgi:NAD(P)-dependent dehydrogenase (short-subunit alcohol dehydrogenase family)
MRHLLNVNVVGTYLFAVAVAKHLIASRAPGSMVFIGTMSGAIVNLPQRQTPYNTSKTAVRHMAASLAGYITGADLRVDGGFTVL